MKSFGSYHKNKNSYTFSGEPLVIQSTYFNCFFQKAIEAIGQYIDVHSLLVNTSQQIAYTQFKAYFTKHSKWDVSERKERVEKYFSYCGFGQINLKNVHPKGGYVETDSESYGLAWKEIFGNKESESDGVAYFTMGFLCGATEAIHDIALGTFDAKQITCIAKGDDTTRVDVFRGLRKKLNESSSEGISQTFESQPRPDNTPVNYETILDAITDQELPVSDSGIINAFGSEITRHYANYFSLIGVKILIELEKKYKRDGVVKSKAIMVQSAQRLVFYTVGKLLLSKEWESTVGASVNTTDDQLHAILAFYNALGWGRWEIERFNPTGKTSFNITNNPSSNAYLKLIGKTKAPICFLLEGIVTATMNMVYNVKLSPGMTLDDDLFNAAFKPDNRYVLVSAKTRITGEETDHFTVARKE
ncbi:MAG: hypothetical protein JXQ96_09360 [Cyclobacteriaceae bacterium]